MKLVIAIIFPFIYFLMVGRIFAAIFSFLLCITGVGWIISAIWGFSDWSNRKNKKQLKAMEKLLDERDQKAAEKAATEKAETVETTKETEEK